MKELSNVKSFQGAQFRYEHLSNTLNRLMTFTVFFPKLLITDNSNFPVIYWLSGLTCTDENFVQKAGIQGHASELGIIIIAPDTSPRGENIPVMYNLREGYHHSYFFISSFIENHLKFHAKYLM